MEIATRGTVGNETDLVLGYGEVGQAIHTVLSERRKVLIVDPAKGYQP